MALQASTAAAIQRLKEVVSSEDDALFSTRTPIDNSFSTIEDVLEQLAKQSQLFDSSGIQSFINGIKELSKAAEKFGHQTLDMNLYLQYLYGPIKLLLQVAQGFQPAVEILINAYGLIGKDLPRFGYLSYASEIDHVQVQQILGCSYSCISDFHRQVYMIFRPPGWKLIFRSSWENFDSRFKEILQILRHLGEFKISGIPSERGVSMAITVDREWLNRVVKSEVEGRELFETKQRKLRDSQMRQAAQWLGANGVQETRLKSLLKTCVDIDDHWLLEQETIAAWLGRAPDPPVVWLTSGPGCGKTVACSKIIEQIQNHTDTVVMYYFISDSESSDAIPFPGALGPKVAQWAWTMPEYGTLYNILRSFAQQLLTNSTSSAPYIVEMFVEKGLAPTKENLDIILKIFIISLPSVRIVIDGLDRGPRSEYDEIIYYAQEIRKLAPPAYKVLFSSRDLPGISKKLQGEAIVRLSNQTASPRLYKALTTLQATRMQTSFASILRRLFDYSFLVGSLGLRLYESYMQRWEPPIDRDKERIRWRCRCGKILWDDFRELRPGAAEDLRRRLHFYMGTMSAQGTNHPQQTPNSYSPGGTATGSVATTPISSNTEALRHSTANVTAEGSIGNAVPPADNTEKKFLLLCFCKPRDTLRLYQLNVEHIKTDFQLFQLLQQTYRDYQGLSGRLLSPRKIKAILERHSFERVVIRSSLDILPRLTNPDVCHKDHGKCDTEYDIDTVPPDLEPYIGRNALEHLLHHPHEAEPEGNNLPDYDVWLQRFPKKVKSKLTECPKYKYGIGWGIEFEEAWNFSWVLKVTLVGCVLAATVFLVCWWSIRGDIQGATGMAAFLVSHGVLLITLSSAFVTA